ncbi:MAG: trypsin-like peptidase domain-containing protein [Bdellovibrionota bacterium]
MRTFCTVSICFSLSTMNNQAHAFFNLKHSSSDRSTNSNPISVSQTDVAQQNCKPKDSTVELNYTMPNGEKKQGSGGIVEIDGKKYVLTAGHVVSDLNGSDGNREGQHKKNIGQQVSLKTNLGKIVTLDLSKAKVHKAFGNETVAIPLEEDIGVPSLKIAEKLSKGTYTHTGYSSKDGYKETKSERASGFGQHNGFAGATRSGEVDPGMSGGMVLDENCNVVGVNSESTTIAGKNAKGINFSKVKGVL